MFTTKDDSDLSAGMARDGGICDSLNDLHRFNINECDVAEAAKKIKPKFTAGDDGIPAFFVHDFLCFVNPLCHLFNCIVASAVFCAPWKTTKIAVKSRQY